jgi:hypothetical protein
MYPPWYRNPELHSEYTKTTTKKSVNRFKSKEEKSVRKRLHRGFLRFVSYRLAARKAFSALGAPKFTRSWDLAEMDG